MRVTSELPIQTQSQAGAPQIASTQSVTPSTPLPVEAAPAVSAAPLQATPAPNNLPANDLHVQIEAPFVFHASGPPPVAKADIAALPLATRPAEALPVDAALPPPTQDAAKSSAADAAANKPPSRGFFRRLGGFFSALFH
jgi:hypothetical protein